MYGFNNADNEREIRAKGAINIKPSINFLSFGFDTRSH